MSPAFHRSNPAKKKNPAFAEKTSAEYIRHQTSYIIHLTNLIVRTVICGNGIFVIDKKQTTMAVNVIVKDTSRALIPFKMMSQVFLQQTLDQIQRNLDTQRVWPYEIYPNFHSINEIRKQNGQWYATGEGYQSLEGEVKQADVDAGLITFAFRFNDYMQYVDIGVGAGRKADDVDRAKNVSYKSRYTKWNASEGKSHRPAIMPELRHLATRLEDYVGDFYGKKFEFDMLETFEGLTITV